MLLSLFSGCGGMDLGFEGGFKVLKKSVNISINKHWNIRYDDKNWVYLPKNRFHTIFANDIRPDAQRTWNNYFSKYGILPDTYHNQSIVDLVKLQKSNQHSIFPVNIDIVTGGFPCQDFSISGKRKGFNSDKSHTGKKKKHDLPSIENRGQLYIWMKEVIALTQPKMFVAENVKGLTNLEDVKEVIEKDFASVCDGGYLVVPARVLSAANYGVPQSRERVIFYGFKKSALKPEAINALSKKNIDPDYDPYPIQTHTKQNSEFSQLKPYVSLKTAFNGLDEPEQSLDVDQKNIQKQNIWENIVKVR